MKDSNHSHSSPIAVHAHAGQSGNDRPDAPGQTTDVRPTMHRQTTDVRPTMHRQTTDIRPTALRRTAAALLLALSVLAGGATLSGCDSDDDYTLIQTASQLATETESGPDINALVESAVSFKHTLDDYVPKKKEYNLLFRSH